MARLFLPPERLGEAQVTLEDEPHRYLTRVLRLGVGAQVTVFDGAGTEVAATVVAVSARATVLALGARRAATIVAQRPVVLLQAVPRGERMDLVVQKTTELGVTRICPVFTTRGVAREGGPGKQRRLATIAQEAARQCGRADVPVIDEPRPLLQALGALPQPPPGLRLVAYEDDRRRPLRAALAGDEREVMLLVGAEGGFTPEEIAAAQAAGFQAVGLGPRTLRSETAAIVAVTLVQAALGALD